MPVFMCYLQMLDAWPVEMKAQIPVIAEKLLVKHVASADEVAEAYLFLMK